MGETVDDPQLQHLLTSPAIIGDKQILVGPLCVRRYCERHKRPPSRQEAQLALRQQFETGQYQRRAPEWLPAELSYWDAYLLLDDDTLVPLRARDDREQEFSALSWFSRQCLQWLATVEITPDVADDAEIDLTAHCVQRYQQRIRPDLSLVQARQELTDLLRVGQIRPEAPQWLQNASHEGHPPYYLVWDDWMALTLRHSGRPEPQSFVATTLLVGDRQAQDCSLREDVAVLAYANRARIDALRDRA